MANILIVDDDAVFRACLKMIFMKEGYNAVEATSVKEALAAISFQHFDLIVTDYDLGSDLNGLSLLAFLKKNNYRMPSILVSANRQEWLETASKELGAFAFLTKPFNLSELRACYRKAIVSGSTLVAA